MNSLPPQLEARIGKVAQQVNRPSDAILFVLRGLAQNHATASGASHIDAAELCWRLHDQAIARFGAKARDQLKSWGIESTNDFGQIVFGLIGEGLATQNETDKLEDFHQLFDFESAFREFRYPPPSGRQFRLSTLFVITTIAAIALSGARGGGVSGALETLLAGWFVVLGASCMWLGMRDRSRGRALIIAVGALFCAGGVIGFALLSGPMP